MYLHDEAASQTDLDITLLIVLAWIRSVFQMKVPTDLKVHQKFTEVKAKSSLELWYCKEGGKGISIMIKYGVCHKNVFVLLHFIWKDG